MWPTRKTARKSNPKVSARFPLGPASLPYRSKSIERHYLSAAYSSSVTGSSHSVPPSEFAAGLMATWTMAEAGAAPCYCFSPGAK